MSSLIAGQRLAARYGSFKLRSALGNLRSECQLLPQKARFRLGKCLNVH